MGDARQICAPQETNEATGEALITVDNIANGLEVKQAIVNAQQEWLRSKGLTEPAGVAFEQFKVTQDRPGVDHDRAKITSKLRKSDRG